MKDTTCRIASVVWHIPPAIRNDCRISVSCILVYFRINKTVSKRSNGKAGLCWIQEKELKNYLVPSQSHNCFLSLHPKRLCFRLPSYFVLFVKVGRGGGGWMMDAFKLEKIYLLESVGDMPKTKLPIKSLGNPKSVFPNFSNFRGKPQVCDSIRPSTT